MEEEQGELEDNAWPFLLFSSPPCSPKGFCYACVSVTNASPSSPWFPCFQKPAAARIQRWQLQAAELQWVQRYDWFSPSALSAAECLRGSLTVG